MFILETFIFTVNFTVNIVQISILLIKTKIVEIYTKVFISRVILKKKNADHILKIPRPEMFFDYSSRILLLKLS